MRALLLLALVAACDRGPKPQPAPEPAPQRPIDAQDLATLPPSARASIPSPPRDQWACGFDVDENQGIREHGHAIFKYGKRTSCHLPLSLITQGVWGCPDSYTRTDASDGMVREHDFTYDDHDRLTEFSVQVIERYIYDGDRLAKTEREQWGEVDHATYRDRGDEVVAVDDQGRLQERLAFNAGQLSADEEYLYGRSAGNSSIRWANGRPQHVSVDVKGPLLGSVSRTFLYDCASPERIQSP